MSLLIGALDTMSTNQESSNIEKIQFGENAHIEYSWSNKLKERILQFFFQLTNSVDEKSIVNLKLVYRNLLQNILNDQSPHQQNNKLTEMEKELTAITIYKMIGQTRDIVYGKGLYNLSYMMIAEWVRYSMVGPKKYSKMCETLASEAITSFVRLDSDEQPYGSWKDMKYFCNYWIEIEKELDNDRTYRLNRTHIKPNPIIIKILNLICTQLKSDETKLSNNEKEISLVAKWIPREKSNKFGWLTHHIAYTYYSDYLINAMGKPNEMTARKKCLTHFRKTISKLNKALHTPQINQCQQNWREIDFDKNVTSITLRKQSLAFQNLTKKNVKRVSKTSTASEDREECCKNFTEYIMKCAKNKSIAKGSNVSMTDFVKSAIENECSKNEMEKLIINSQWENNSINTKKLGNIIAMVDTSGSMEADNGTPLYSAIGLGIRIAEKSALGRRILTFSSRPEWINLDNIDKKDFVSMVHKVRSAPWGMNTNFYGALNLILEAIIEQELDPDDVENMTLVILSDMQIDRASKENMDSMFITMENLYKEAGLKTAFNKPYKLPHILFWNLRTTDGFPCISSAKNVSMMSGSSPALLNKFSDRGVESLKESTPWNTMQEILSNKRYDLLEKIFQQEFNKIRN